MVTSGLLTLDFTYGTTDNNGNVRTQTIAAAPVGLNVTQHYRYDGVNRLTIAAEGAQPTQDDVCPAGAIWCRDYAYDAFGNRAASGSAVGLGTPSSLAAFNSANNRLLTGSWAEYDASGNQTDFKYPSVGPCNQRFAEYDAENKMKAFGQAVNVNPTGTPDCPDVNNRVAIATYAYDGDGNRVQKVLSGGATTTYVYDAFGRLAAEYSTAGPSGAGGIEFRTTDHLGSTRLVTDEQLGDEATPEDDVVLRRDFFPFGEEIPANASFNRAGMARYNEPNGFAQQFTGKERDGESGLDYFGARYLSASLGRFGTSDPIIDNSLRRVSPQRWNRYSYALNNPLLFIDPDGRDAMLVNTTQAASGFGHSGVASVNPRTGRVKYGDFGPRTSGNPRGPGRVTIALLREKLSFDSNGYPTEKSLAKVNADLARILHADPNTITIAYYKTSDGETARLDSFLDEAGRRESAGQTPGYQVGARDCIEFCNQALQEAGVLDRAGSRAFLIPNIFQYFALSRSDVSFKGRTGKREINRQPVKTKVTSSITFCPNGYDPKTRSCKP